jgi:hypothetical protein
MGFISDTDRKPLVGSPPMPYYSFKREGETPNRRSFASQIMLKGSELITIVEMLRAQGKTATDIVLECGYVKENGKGAYTEFYTELLTAKGTLIQQQSPEISDEYQAQYDSLIESYPQDAVDTFIELFGEECLESFEDSYRGEWDSEADYAQDWFCGCYNIPEGIVIDWQATYDQQLSECHTFEDGYMFYDQF